MMLKTRKILEKLSVRWYNVHHHLLRQQNDLSISQKQAVECSNLGLSIFVHLQTGSGKSLTYQIPALMAPAHKITIIVSPLVALINVSYTIFRG
jgi:superfamily II DNA helicase RecQ